MLTQDDLHTLTAAATARLFCAMVLVAQEASPVDRLDDFKGRGHDLLTDLQTCLDTAPDASGGDLHAVAFRYCDTAMGSYSHDAVALAVQRGLSDLCPVFDGLPMGPAEAIRDWIREHADRDHTLAWLSEQTANLLVADSANPHDAQKEG
jgi:hypothetical protein